jgi:two-component system cell cycle sensor histidine kinase/response regulator CckA
MPTTLQEELLRALIEHSSDAIVVLDPGGTIRFASESIRRVTGFAPEEVVGENAFARVHPDDRAAVEQAVRRSIALPAEHIVVEFRTRHKDGNWRHREAIIVNRLDHPAVRGLIANYRDTTARHEAEEALRQTTERHARLEEKFRQAQKMEAVGRLAGGIAHDFNNVLTTILGYSNLILAQLQPTRAIRLDIEEIRRSAESAALLTRQLLAFSRKQVLQTQVLDLNALVTNIAMLLKRTLGEDVQFVTRLAPALGLVIADPAQIEQVIMNLAVNARDAMPNGGALTIETSEVRLDAETAARHVGASPGAYVHLAISDTGVGMDATVRAHLFEPFYTTKERGKGTGLGLSTVYGIVTQSGGFLTVDSEPGRGSTFHIYLPRSDEALAQATPLAETLAWPGGSETILLVEDHLDVRNVMHEMLARHGYTVLDVGSGEDALDLLQHHASPIDLLLTDIVMPRMSGRDLARQTLMRHPGMQVLYISGYADHPTVAQGLDAGLSLIQKPFAPGYLLHKVRQALDGRASS